MQPGSLRQRILFLSRTLSGAGAELVVELLCSGLDSARFDCAVCELSGHGERARALAARGFRVHTLNPDATRLSIASLLVRLRRVLAKDRYDLVHSHSTDALAAAALCRLTLRRLRHVHTFHFGNYPHRDRMHLTLERLFHRFPDQLVAVGYRQADAISETYGLDRSRLRVIWNGIGESAARADDDAVSGCRRAGRLLIGAIGTLTAQKGHDVLLETAALLKKRGVAADFLLIGDGPLRPALEARARELGLGDEVRFLGWIPDAARSMLPGIDIFFQPSRWEAMSMVLLEAAAAGLPIVCTDVGEASRILTDGESAVIVQPGDAAAMARALEGLAADQALRERLGRAARERVRELCSLDQMIREHESLYSRVIGPAHE